MRVEKYQIKYTYSEEYLNFYKVCSLIQNWNVYNLLLWRVSKDKRNTFTTTLDIQILTWYYVFILSEIAVKNTYAFLFIKL